MEVSSNFLETWLEAYSVGGSRHQVLTQSTERVSMNWIIYSVGVGVDFLYLTEIMKFPSFAHL